MKFRTDFVTNSSSSSFICAFSGKKDFDEKMKALSNKVGPVYFGCIYRDLTNPDYRMTRKDALKAVYDSIQNYFYCDVAYGSRMRYWDKVCEDRGIRTYDLMKVPEFVAEVKEKTNAEYERVLKKFPDRGFYVELEYSDNDGEISNELEHDVMPRIPFVVYTINKH